MILEKIKKKSVSPDCFSKLLKNAETEYEAYIKKKYLNRITIK